jgi:hypothetical protein
VRVDRLTVLVDVMVDVDSAPRRDQGDGRRETQGFSDAGGGCDCLLSALVGQKERDLRVMGRLSAATVRD